jgi:hypothetical protein
MQWQRLTMGGRFFYFWGKEEKAVAKDTFSKAPKCR